MSLFSLLFCWFICLLLIVFWIRYLIKYFAKQKTNTNTNNPNFSSKLPLKESETIKKHSLEMESSIKVIKHQTKPVDIAKHEGVSIYKSRTTSFQIHKGKNILESINDYVVIDLETTGLSPRFNEIIEIAAIKVVNGNTSGEFQVLVKPTKQIEQHITNLTSITNEMVSNAESIQCVLPKLLDFVGSYKIIARNANFDIDFLCNKCADLSPPIDFTNDFIDTMEMSRWLYPKEQHHRLQDLTQRFGLDSQIEHRALTDAQKTKDCYEFMKTHIHNNHNHIIVNNKNTNSNLSNDDCVKSEEEQIKELEIIELNAKNIIDLHFTYNGLIDLTYKKRKDPRYLILCMNYCKKDIDIYLSFRDAWQDKYPEEKMNIFIPSFERLAIIYEKQGSFEDAIDICELAKTYSLNSTSNGGWERRLERVRQKLNH